MRALPLLLLIACNGSDTDLDALTPTITVAPDALVFGEQPIFSDGVQEVFIANGGRAPLDFTLTIEGSEAFTVPFAAGEVARGESLAVPVTFHPTDFVTSEASLLVTSNDPETPEVRVALSGLGSPAPVPDITLEPGALDFEEQAPGAPELLYAAITNDGTADLLLGTIAQTGSGAFSLVTDPSGATVAPGTSLPVLVSYDPVNTAGDNAEIVIPSNDPDEGLVTLRVLGNGGGGITYPIAVLDCPETVAPPEDVFIDGSASHHPDGIPITWDWTLTGRPPGSQANLGSFVGPTTNFFADSAGTYEVELVVTDEGGLRSPAARCLIEAVPQDAVHVELTWDTTRADLDLHLLRGDGEFFVKPGDANYCNPEPNWGGPGEEDDPSLDLDDRGGLGPENISILAPSNDTYTVNVHYFDNNGDGDVNATLRVYLHGALVAELSKVMRRNDVWDAGQINWPAATFGAHSVDLFEAPRRACE